MRAAEREGVLRAGAWSGGRHVASVFVNGGKWVGGARDCDFALSISVHGTAVEAAGSTEARAAGRARRSRGSVAAHARPDARGGRQIVWRTHDVASASGVAVARCSWIGV